VLTYAIVKQMALTTVTTLSTCRSQQYHMVLWKYYCISQHRNIIRFKTEVAISVPLKTIMFQSCLLNRTCKYITTV